MTKRKVMPRDEVFALIARSGAALLAGKPMPEIETSYDHMCVEDSGDAMDAFLRSVATRFDEVPAKVSGDLAVQEVARGELDKVFADAALNIRQLVSRLQQGEGS